jgi:hypothetical protein
VSRQSNRESAPSVAAEHFLAIVGPRWGSIRLLKVALEPWLKSNGIKWRIAADFFSGIRHDFPGPQLLAQFISDQLGQTHHYREFTHVPGIRNFPAEFAGNHLAGDILRFVSGAYQCFRPAITLSKDEIFRRGERDDKHELRLADHGDSRPGTFRYSSTDADGITLGAWEGCAVARMTYIFLCGYCLKGEDVAYFILRPHPDKEYSEKILVGMQSLLLLNPPPRAVSRPIAAVKIISSTMETLTAADQWIEANRRAGEALINLGEQPSRKT